MSSNLEPQVNSGPAEIDHHQVLLEVADRNYDVFDRSIDVHISSLRKKMGDDPKSLLNLTEEKLRPLREPFLRALNSRFQAPNKVGLYLFTDGSWVVENFNDTPVVVELKGQSLNVVARGWSYQWKH